MKKVYIKYNPYKLETQITVDGNDLAQNSVIGELACDGTRLQEWIERLPQILVEEYNDDEFEIAFKGTVLDFEDLREVFLAAQDKGLLKAEYERIPAKETEDKEKLIDEIFADIQAGPFEELREADVINAFQLAKSSDFEVCVVATMSSGKSTLINAMLGDKLMPSKQEACTAIITRIKDDDGSSWRAETFDKEGKLISKYEDLTYPLMEELNDDQNVSLINARGNIPFVTSEDVSLVLIDTPGPNNARNPEHKAVQNGFLSKSSKSLVLYIMTSQFGTDDDDALLSQLSESMSVGGKQSKDRFIFVVNKLDNRRKDDGDVSQTLDRVKAHLKVHGIVNPNLFPAAALPALDIRQVMKSDGSEEEIEEGIEEEAAFLASKLNKVRKNDGETLHFEKYASLPQSVKQRIELEVQKAHDAGDTYAEALIHSGITSVEAAISQYVRKYAKTAKVRNIVDTFIHKLDEVGCFEATKNELLKNQEDRDAIVEQLKDIQKKIDDVENAKGFKERVSDQAEVIVDEAKNQVEDIVADFQAKVNEVIRSYRDKEIPVDEVTATVKELADFAKGLEPQFRQKLDDIIQDGPVKTCEVLIKEYRDKLSKLTEDIGGAAVSSIKIDPMSLVDGSVKLVSTVSTSGMTYTKKVEDGTEWIPNTDKKWYKPWTWFQESGYTRTKYKNVEFVKGNELAQEYFAGIFKSLSDNGEAANKHAIKQSNKIVREFGKEFERLDSILKKKLKELELCASDREDSEARIKETEDKLTWLKQTKERVESILEI